MKGRTGKIFFSRIFEGEDLAEAIKKRVEESEIKSGLFILIGSLQKAVIGYYKEGQYYSLGFDGPLEIASCMGNISVNEKGETAIHTHVVVANEKGEAFGGHLMKDCLVGATAELVIIEAVGAKMERALDKKTGLHLWKV